MPAPLDRTQFRARFQKGGLDPVYVLFGRETYLRDLALKAIRKRAFSESDLTDFNDDLFSLADPANIKTALAAADQLPMMSERRVVTVTDVRIGNSSMSDSLKEEYLEAVAAYLASPSPTTVFIFLVEELNGTRRVGKLLKEKALAVEFAPLAGKDLGDWVRDRIRESGAEIDEPTFRYLLSVVGTDARRFVQEIEKLSTATIPEHKIDIELIDQLVLNTSEASNFDLTKYLSLGDQRNALRTLKKIMDDGAEPVALVGLLSFSFRRLLAVKDMIDRNVPRNEAGRIMKLRYNDQEEIFAAARRSSRSRLIKALSRIAETDLAIKTSLGGPSPKGSRLQLEMLVCELSM